MTREGLYDEKVFPLMAEIIRLCKEGDIPFVASFQLDDDRSAPDLLCTSCYLPADSAGGFKQALRAIRAEEPMFQITVKDGDGRVTESRVVVGSGS